MTESIFREPPVRVLFANWADLQDPYVAAANAIKDTDCRNVGLRLDSHDLEYPWWWLLEAPESGFRLETIYALPWLEKLVDPEFRPCAILCTICGDERTTLHGLPLVEDFGPVRLYAGPDDGPEEGG